MEFNTTAGTHEIMQPLHFGRPFSQIPVSAMGLRLAVWSD